MKMIEAIVFDIGGVFLSQPDELLQPIVQDYGLTPADLDEAMSGQLWDDYKRGKLSEAECWREIAHRLPATFDGRLDLLKVGYEDCVLLNESLVGVARKLKQQYRIAALSNAGAELEHRLEQQALAPLFELVVNSHRVGMAKPDEAIYEYTSAKLNLSPAQILFVDDKKRNTLVADGLGFHTHVFEGTDKFLQFLKAEKLYHSPRE